jgi:hypothetical protein
MPKVITIHASTEPEAFHLLLLSEGFVLDPEKKNEKNFYAYCHRLTQALFLINPFGGVRCSFSVSALFVASNEEGISEIGGLSRDTAFSFYKTVDKKLVTKDYSAIVSCIKGLQVDPPVGSTNALPLLGEEIWLNPLTEGRRAVCVVANVAGEKLATTHIKPILGPDTDPPIETDDVLNLIPLVVVGMYPLAVNGGASAVYINSHEMAAAILAHELGHVFGLGDEYERGDAEYEVYYGDEPDIPNVTTSSEIIDETGSVVLSKLKWLEECSLSRRSRSVRFGFQVSLSEAETEEYVVQVQASMAASIVRLDHPVTSQDDVDTASWTHLRYLDGPLAGLLTDEPNLIEGAHYYRKGVFRSSAECMMRWEMSEQISVGNGKFRREAIPFCRTCRRNVLGKLFGYRDFLLGGVRIVPAIQTREGKVASRLAEAFVKYLLRTEFPEDMICVEATIRRFVTFFKDELRWKNTVAFPLGQDELTGWYTNKVDFPRLAGSPLRMWHIWMTNLGKLREGGVVKFAGLGAAGALWYGGFGTLANRRKRAVEGDLTYWLAEGLSRSELETIAPGSMLQLWKSQSMYKEIVRYAAGLTTDPPDAEGHSVIYMGKDSQSRHIVADQEGVQEPLEEGWRAPYRFWIATQWHDATNARVA